jgi:hypothetical protein
MVLEETDNVWIAVGLSPTGLMVNCLYYFLK